MAGELRRRLAGLPPFTLTAGGLSAGSAGVLLDFDGDQSGQPWHEPTAQVRAAIEKTGGPEAATRDPGPPHICLTYCRKATDSGDLQERLRRQVRPARAPFAIREAHLLDVIHDPDAHLHLAQLRLHPARRRLTDRTRPAHARRAGQDPQHPGVISVTNQHTTEPTDLWSTPIRLLMVDYGGVLASTGYTEPTIEAVRAVTDLSVVHGLPMILASNTSAQQPHGVRTTQLRDAGILGCFAAIIESEHLGCGKPDPRFFHAARDAALALLPDLVPHEVAWLDDSDRRGIVPALQHGWRAVWVSDERDDRLLAAPGVRRIPNISALHQALGLGAPCT